ncbi:unnamed protein product [Caenorhabditis angaria]|uniref:Uncharacterized protein n=1 Tax=Caenorhabditis angaria TaxID=860376 RepID=A0A9P1IJT0_9PELO|nr:unnamed protein product [Caenorhabditis angaria]
MMSEAMDKLMETHVVFGKRYQVDVYQQIKQLAKVCKDLGSNRKKSEKDPNTNYLVDAFLERLKELTEESLITLEKFNKEASQCKIQISREFQVFQNLRNIRILVWNIDGISNLIRRRTWQIVSTTRQKK